MRAKQPKIKIERNGLDLLLEVSALIMTLVPFVYLALHWGSLPDRIPTHFNAAGVVDGWGGRGDLLILPGVMVIDLIMLTVLQRFPHTFNYIVKITDDNAEAQYRIAVSMMGWMNLILAAGMASLFLSMAEAATRGADRITPWVTGIFMACLFANLGIFLVRSWQNR